MACPCPLSPRGPLMASDVAVPPPTCVCLLGVRVCSSCVMTDARQDVISFPASHLSECLPVTMCACVTGHVRHQEMLVQLLRRCLTRGHDQMGIKLLTCSTGAFEGLSPLPRGNCLNVGLSAQVTGDSRLQGQAQCCGMFADVTFAAHESLLRSIAQGHTPVT